MDPGKPQRDRADVGTSAVSSAPGAMQAVRVHAEHFGLGFSFRRAGCALQTRPARSPSTRARAALARVLASQTPRHGRLLGRTNEFFFLRATWAPAALIRLAAAAARATPAASSRPLPRSQLSRCPGRGRGAWGRGGHFDVPIAGWRVYGVAGGVSRMRGAPFAGFKSAALSASGTDKATAARGGSVGKSCHVRVAVMTVPRERRRAPGRLLAGDRGTFAFFHSLSKYEIRPPPAHAECCGR